MSHKSRAFVQAVLMSFGLAAMTVPQVRSECTSSLLFESPLRFHTGPSAHFIAQGDFNEDGILDFAVTNRNAPEDGNNATVAIFLGTGGRSYAPPALYGVAQSPRGIVAADFNEDGITDLATANTQANNVSILIGQGAGGVGNGTFFPAVGFFAGSGPFEIIAADFDRDGILDLACSLNFVAGVTVMRGLGSGGVGNGMFGNPITLALSEKSTGIASGDFNNDDIPDLVATENGSATIAVFLGTGAATLGYSSFSSATHFGAGPVPFHFAVSDFDEDGDQDLAVANIGGGGISVMIGTGNGTFPTRVVVNSGNSSTVAVGDANQDGIMDIFTGTVTGNNNGIVEVFLGQGAGGVGNGAFGGQTIYSSGGDVYQMISDDFDADGYIDLLVADGYGDFVGLLPGTCAVAPPDPRYPVLTDVRDVPNDDGGRVFVTWTASSLDITQGPVNNYRVWRRIPPGLAIESLAARMASREVMAIPQPETSEIVYWEALATLPAQRLQGYGYTAPTTQDSMRNSNPYTAFFVTALTSDIDQFYSSNVDSGYSVDNNKPNQPQHLTGEPTGSGFALAWDASPETDLEGYRVYRGSEAGFMPSEESLVGAPSEVGWTDSQGHGEWYYKLSAVDLHGNESDYAVLAPMAPTAVGGSPVSFALHGARPNPSVDGTLRIHFSLANDDAGRLEVMDLAGRKVLSRDLSGSGNQVITVGEGGRLAPGIYLVRLSQRDRSREIKAIVAR